MVTRREVLILGAGVACLPACGGGGGSGGGDGGSRGLPDTGSVPPRPGAPPPDTGPRVYGTKILEWTQPQVATGAGVVAAAAAERSPSPSVLRMTQGVPASLAQQAVLAEVAGMIPKGTSPGFTVGIWARNPQGRTLDFTFAIASAAGAHELRWHCAVDPSDDWVFLTMSPTQQLPMGWQFGVDAPAAVRVTQQDDMSEGPWQAGEYLLFGPVYVDLAYRPSFLITFDDGLASQRHAPSASVPSGQQVVERYGFKGTLFIVPSWLGSSGVYGYGKTRNSFLSVDDVLTMRAEGWTIGSHSNTHPSSGDNAGLRLLGPYGYFLSNPVDMLPPAYVRFWELGAGHRRRVVRASAGSAVLEFENPHRLLVNMPISFTDTAPPGFSIGVVYYCQDIPSETSASFATDQGSLDQTVSAAASWNGLANYRYPGSANDDSAIHADIMVGVAGLARLGIATGANYFALPQGSADRYVRSACIRSGIKWIRGASSFHGQTFSFGRPTGGGLSQVLDQPGGWLAHPDSVQTDAGETPSPEQIRNYVDTTLHLGACGCSYHHGVGPNTVSNLETLCAYLRTKVDARLVDVLTLEQFSAAGPRAMP